MQTAGQCSTVNYLGIAAKRHIYRGLLTLVNRCRPRVIWISTKLPIDGVQGGSERYAGGVQAVIDASVAFAHLDKVCYYEYFTTVLLSLWRRHCSTSSRGRTFEGAHTKYRASMALRLPPSEGYDWLGQPPFVIIVFRGCFVSISQIVGELGTKIRAMWGAGKPTF